MVAKLQNIFFWERQGTLEIERKIVRKPSKRGNSFSLPKSNSYASVNSQQCGIFIQDNPTFISLSEIYKEGCEKRNTDPEQPIAIYYEKLAQIQSRGYMFNHQSLREILKEVGEIFCTIYTVKNLQDRPNQFRVEIYSLSRYICSEITCQWVQ